MGVDTTRQGRSRTSSHFRRNHWASKCRTTFAEDFREKHLPLEANREESAKQEMEELQKYFHMGDEHPQESQAAYLFAAMAFSESHDGAEEFDINSSNMAFKPLLKMKMARQTDKKMKKLRAPKRGKLWAQVAESIAAEDAQVTPLPPPRCSSTPPQAVNALAPRSSSTTSQQVNALSPPQIASPTPRGSFNSSRQSPGTTGPGGIEKDASATRAADEDRLPPTRARHEEEMRSVDRPQSSMSVVDKGGLHSRPQSRAQSTLPRNTPTPSLSRKRSPSEEHRVQERKQIQQRLHKPVSGQELIHAHMPEPLSFRDFPPIFTPRPDSAQESHFEYFARRCPRTSPNHRRVVQRAIESQRCVLHYCRPSSPDTSYSHSFMSNSIRSVSSSSSPSPHWAWGSSHSPASLHPPPMSPDRCQSAQGMYGGMYGGAASPPCDLTEGIVSPRGMREMLTPESARPPGSANPRTRSLRAARVCS